MRFFRILTIVLLTALSACGLAFADFPSQQENIFAGEFRGYDALVPVGNYNFVRGVILVFGNRWAAPARSYEELNQQIWDQLLLSYEAFRRGINVDKDTLDQEIEKVLNAEKINFDWKKNPKAYAKWVQDKLKEPPEVFENQLRHLLQIENLRKTIMESASIKVSEEEAFREFLNEYNTLELELYEFADLQEAKSFYEKIKADAAYWQEAAEKDPSRLKKPGFVSLEFLAELWKVPQEDLYAMLKQGAGAFYPPTALYRGFAVYKIIQTREADEKQFSELREGYIKQVEAKKRLAAYDEWFAGLKKEADPSKVWIVR